MPAVTVAVTVKLGAVWLVGPWIPNSRNDVARNALLSARCGGQTNAAQEPHVQSRFMAKTMKYTQHHGSSLAWKAGWSEQRPLARPWA